MEVYMKAKAFFKKDYEKVVKAISSYVNYGRPAIEVVTQIHEPILKALESKYGKEGVELVSERLKGTFDNITTRSWKDTLPADCKDEIQFADELVSNIQKYMKQTPKKNN